MDPYYSIGDNISLEGYYPGTLGFENEEDRTSETDIAFVGFDEHEVSTTVEIVSECNGHEKVLKLTSTPSGFADIKLNKDLTKINLSIRLREPFYFCRVSVV